MILKEFLVNMRDSFLDKFCFALWSNSFHSKTIAWVEIESLYAHELALDIDDVEGTFASS